MNTQIRFLAQVLIFSLFISQALFAQDKISSSVLGNGAAAAAGAKNKIVGTLGQAVIGVTGSSDASHRAGFWYSTIDLVTSVEQIENELLPTEFRLEQNYPNPFNPSTTIRFAVPKASHVTIQIYDVLGRQVATLVDEEYQAGVYKVVFEAGDLTSGLYIYRIQTEAFTQSRKLMLLK